MIDCVLILMPKQQGYFINYEEYRGVFEVAVSSDFFYGHVKLLLKRYELLSNSLEERLNSLPDKQQENRDKYAAFLDRQAADLNNLLNDENFGNEAILSNQIVRYRRCYRNLIYFEQTPSTVLYHFSDKDMYLCSLINRLCDQIKYPYTYPLVCAQSNQSFYTHPDFNLIYSNFLEDESLLACPDFFHELGHLFFDCCGKKETFESFLQSLQQYIKRLKRSNPFSFYSHALWSHFSGELSAEEQSFNMLEKTWEKHYLEEFACDMFATYLVGPAFGWTHLRLLLSDKSHLYYPGFGQGSSHPANEARMRGILLVLEKLEDDSALGIDLSQQWDEYRRMIQGVISNDGPNERYALCYDDQLLEHLVDTVINCCEDNELVPYYNQPQKEQTNIASLMQMAWERFLDDPETYDQWETNMVDNLKSVF